MSATLASCRAAVRNTSVVGFFRKQKQTLLANLTRHHSPTVQRRIASAIHPALAFTLLLESQLLIHVVCVTVIRIVEVRQVVVRVDIISPAGVVTPQATHAAARATHLCHE